MSNKISFREHDRCAGALARSQGPFVLAGTERVYERSRPFLFEHLALDLELDLKHKTVAGVAELAFSRVAERGEDLVLDAVGFDVQSVALSTQRGFSAADYDYVGDRITVRIA
jgi:aminopeptidase N